MKRFFTFVSILAAIFLTGFLTSSAQVSNNYWKLTAGTIQPNLSTWTFTLPYLPSKNCIGTDSNGLFQTGSCGSGGGTDPFSHTTNFGQNVSATSTAVWFQAAPFSLMASSTAVFSAFNSLYGTTTYASSTALTSTALYSSNATSTNLFSTTASTTNLFGAFINGFGLTSCTGTNALTWSGGSFSCTAQPQGTVTSVSGTTNRITSTGGATPVIDISASYVGQSSITTVGTLSSGAVPASLITAGTFGGSTKYTFPQDLIITGNSTTTNATTTNSFSSIASSTNLFTASFSGAGLVTCSGSSFLQWTGGTFSCAASSAGAAYPFSVTTPAPGNATSTLTQFNGGLTAYASTTIGDSTQVGGLTVSGGATTTGNAYFDSNIGIGIQNISGNVYVNEQKTATNAAGTTGFQGIITNNSSGGSFAVSGVAATAAFGSTASGNLTATTNGGGIRNRYISNNTAPGYNVAQQSALSALIQVNGVLASTTNASDFHAETPVVSTGLLTNFYGLWVRGGTVAATLTNRYGVYIEDMIGGINKYGFYQAGINDTNYFAGNMGIGTSTPWATLSVGTSTATTILPLFAVASSSAAIATSTLFLINGNGNVGIGSTTPVANLAIGGTAGTDPFLIGSSTGNLFGINQWGQPLIAASQPATSTTITLDWSKTSRQVEYQIGSVAIKINVISATTSQFWGTTKIVWVCNPGGTAGALTWSGVEWVGTAPSQTTTANQCDVYSFNVTHATSTTVYKVAGSSGAGFQ